MRLFTAPVLALLSLFVLAPHASAQAPTVTVTNDVAANATWTADNVYLLDGLIYVRPGATLTIQPGTIIKGRAVPSPATGDLASGLVVMVDADLIADGRADAPIIMTAEADNVSIATDLDEFDRALWGGLILLGRATTNATPGVTNVEGIPPSDDTRFGCDGSPGFACDDEDSSGVLRYVSVRHGGFGFETDSEINGITFGAVGRGTTVEYVEVFANSDDNFEFFGGTVSAKYLVGAYSGDDTFDTDRGFRGRFQFGLSVNNPGADAGRCFENDGGVSSLGGEDATPFSIPVYSNITCIGAGEDADITQLGEEGNSAALQLRDNTGGKIYNSIFVDYPQAALDLEALSSGEDTENRFGQNTEADDLTIRNNYFFGFGDGTTFAAIVNDDSDNTSARQSEIETLIGASNLLADPMLVNLSGRTRGADLDPRPVASSPVVSAASFDFDALDNDGDDDFFTAVEYLGAFAPGEATWLAGWSVLATNGYLSGPATPNEDGSAATGFGLASVYPNPLADAATVTFELDRAETATVAVYDVLGREVAVLADGPQAAGRTTVRFDAAALPTGIYFVRLATGTATATQKVAVVR
jgi:hypothetical protein